MYIMCPCDVLLPTTDLSHKSQVTITSHKSPVTSHKLRSCEAVKKEEAVTGRVAYSLRSASLCVRGHGPRSIFCRTQSGHGRHSRRRSAKST